MMWHAQELEPKFLFRCPNSIDHRMVGVGIHFLIWQWHRVPKMARWSYFYCFQWCFGWLKNPPPNGRWSRTPVFALADKQTERAIERERERDRIWYKMNSVSNPGSFMISGGTIRTISILPVYWGSGLSQSLWWSDLRNAISKPGTCRRDVFPFGITIHDCAA